MEEALFNWVTVTVLVSVISCWILDTVATLLNLSAFSEKVPQEFEGIYSPEDYALSQSYTRAKAQFGLIHDSFETALFLVAWWTGFFNTADVFVRSFNQGSIVTGIIYLFSLALLMMIIELPWSIYRTFVLEERFGFNKTTIGTFVKDMFKTIALSVALGTPLLAGVLWFFEFSGDRAWLYCWITTSVVSLVLTFLAPKYILPCFNKLEPLEDGELSDAIAKLSSEVGFEYSGIFVMDGSKRSNHSNAFFTGFGPTKRIVLFDTLVEKQSVDELTAVLGHEIGHYKKHHIVLGIVLSILQTGVLFRTMQLFVLSSDISRAFFMNHVSIYAGIIFFSQLYSPVSMVLTVLMTIFSRRNEYQADQFAVDVIADPEALVSGLKKLSRDNLSNLTPHPFITFLSYTHPPVLKRIEAIRAHASSRAKKTA